VGSLPVTLSGPALTSAGLSDISITASNIDVEGTRGLGVQPGGSIEFQLTGQGAITNPHTIIAADLTAPGGSIVIVAQPIPFVARAIWQHGFSRPAAPVDYHVSATLSVRGRWVNDAGTPADGRGGAGFVNGGSLR